MRPAAPQLELGQVAGEVRVLGRARRVADQPDGEEGGPTIPVARLVERVGEGVRGAGAARVEREGAGGQCARRPQMVGFGVIEGALRERMCVRHR